MVVSVAPSCLHPTSAKQAASVSNAISFIVELLLITLLLNALAPRLRDWPFRGGLLPIARTLPSPFFTTPCGTVAR